ncbi:GNAT family N-acetyltransferase [Bacillaceae bacterium IKA-2]|nr:GNAT family N-acetyltransferase [Bacillaceae bacterium IKA-2]
MDKIYEGTLVCQTNGISKKFQVKKLNQRHISEILQVQSIVLENEQVKESLEPLTEEEIRHIFNDMGHIIGVFVKNCLIAFRALLYPGDNMENLGSDLDLTKDEQMKVIHLEITCVIPKYRGNGLQKILGNILMKEFIQSSINHRYLCCTVSPNNFPSLKDKLIQGMHIVKLKKKYSGGIRYILLKDLHTQMKIREDTIISVSSNDFEQQHQLLENGFAGFNLIENKLEKKIVFGKSKDETLE